MKHWTKTQTSASAQSFIGRRSTKGGLSPGMVLEGRYRVIRSIGSGGMGEVYEVEHTILEHRCALKVLLPQVADREETLQRFHREARSMAKVQSAHVTRIMDFGSLEDGLPFFVMELLRGDDLSRVLSRDGKLAIDRAVRIASDACWGLSAVHDAALVHRDIKPANLFVVRDHAGIEHCKILDFGVAKTGLTTDTSSGRWVGTLRYMAPEQLEGEKLDGRTDIYALSAVLYECLAGVAPHQSDRLERVLFSIMNETPTPLEQLRPDIPLELCRTILRGLACSPEQRFASARELAEALQPFAAEYRTASIRPEPALPLVGNGPDSAAARRRRRFRIVAVMAAASAIIGGASAVLLRNAPPQIPRLMVSTSVGKLAASREAARARAALEQDRTRIPAAGSKSDDAPPPKAPGSPPLTEPSPMAATDATSNSRRELDPSRSLLLKDARLAVSDSSATRPATATAGTRPRTNNRRPPPSTSADSALLRVGSEVSPASIDPQNPYGN